MYKIKGSVAVDWINDKLYWCDENTSRIEVSELSGSNRKVLLDTDILYPRDLVIDPITRYILLYVTNDCIYFFK